MSKRKWSDYTVYDDEWWRGLTWRIVVIFLIICAIGMWLGIGS